jgi:hypothetical protein
MRVKVGHGVGWAWVLMRKLGVCQESYPAHSSFSLGRPPRPAGTPPREGNAFANARGYVLDYATGADDPIQAVVFEFF